MKPLSHITGNILAAMLLSIFYTHGLKKTFCAVLILRFVKYTKNEEVMITQSIFFHCGFFELYLSKNVCSRLSQRGSFALVLLLCSLHNYRQNTNSRSRKKYFGFLWKVLVVWILGVAHSNGLQCALKSQHHSLTL